MLLSPLFYTCKYVGLSEVFPLQGGFALWGAITIQVLVILSRPFTPFRVNSESRLYGLYKPDSSGSSDVKQLIFNLTPQCEASLKRENLREPYVAMGECSRTYVINRMSSLSTN